MFNIEFVEHSNDRFSHYILSNHTGNQAVIYPALGASLQQLDLGATPIINNIIGTKESPELLNSSCSAILFPFANRINKGQYKYQGTAYQLECNEQARGHAMHGLVYREGFDLLDRNKSKEQASIRFVNHQDDTRAGFPFPFQIVLTYTLTETNLELEVTVENKGTCPFPFSLGWHPYFYSTNLEESTLYLDSQHEIKTDEGMIPTGIHKTNFPNPLSLNQEQFDTGFILESPEIYYKTPDYQIRINIEQDMEQPYVQLYIPSHRQSIAIEPMTAATDCYNNNWGTRELLPQKEYAVIWKIELSTES